MPSFSTEPHDAEERDRQAAQTVAFLLSLRARGVRDTALLRAMESVPRNVFAPPRCADLSRADVSLPLPCGQTMLAPSAIALLVGHLKVAKGHKVLEVGTGSGYVTALLATLAGGVASIERYRTLAIAASERLASVGIGQAHVLHGDGFDPPPEIDGLDRILLTGSVSSVPAALLARLKPEGRLVAVVTLQDGARVVTFDRTQTGAFQEERHAQLRIPPLVPGLARSL